MAALCWCLWGCRDSFANVVDLLDDLFQRAAAAEEPPELNYIRKHALELEKAGVSAPAARIFSNPAGDYGSMVNERVGAADWEGGAELGDTWRSRNSFSYGKGGERGVARPEVMQQLLRTTQHIVQEIDSVEYGLTDIQVSPYPVGHTAVPMHIVPEMDTGEHGLTFFRTQCTAPYGVHFTAYHGCMAGAAETSQRAANA